MSNQKKVSTKDKLMKKKAKELDDEIMAKLLDSDRVTPEAIKYYNEAKTSFNAASVENPLFILDNKELMELRLEHYIESMKDVIRNNDDSVTDESAEKLLNNNYVSYITYMLKAN